MRTGERLEATVDEPPVPGDLDLVGEIVLAHADVGGGRREDVGVLTGRDATQLGDVVLDDERAARLEVPGGIAEARNLFVLARQVRDRVAQEIHDAERPLHGGRRKVAKGDADALRTRLRLKLGGSSRRKALCRGPGRLGG